MIPVQLGPFTRWNPGTPKRDILPTELSVLENSLVESGCVVMLPGWEPLLGSDTTFSERILHLAEHQAVGGARYLCIHTPTKFYVWDGDSLSDLSRSGGYNAVTELWTSCSFGDLYVFSNGVDTPQKWDSGAPTAVAQNFTGAPKAKIYRTFASYMLAANIVDATDAAAGKLIKWCAAGDPTNWTTGDSGSQYVYEAEGDINDIQPLTRDTLSVYKDYSVHTLSLQTFPFTFVVTSMMRGIGVLARRGVARIHEVHICLTNEGIMGWDGSTFIPMGPEIANEVKKYHPSANTRQSIVYALPMRNEIWVLLAGASGNCETAFIFNTITKSWSFVNGLNVTAVCLQASPTIVWTWDDIVGSWDNQVLSWDGAFSPTDEALFVSSYADPVYRLCGATKGNPVYIRDSVAVTGRVETEMINPAALNYQKAFNKSELVQLFVGILAGSPNVYIGTSETGIGIGDVTWHGPYVPDTNGLIYTTITNRFFMFRVEDTKLFKVTHITPYFVLRGVL